MVGWNQAQHSTAQHSAAQHSTAQHSAAQRSTAQARQHVQKQVAATYLGGLSLITIGDASATTKGARNVMTMASFSGSKVTAKK